MILHDELEQFMQGTYMQRRQWMLRADVRKEVEREFDLPNDDARAFLAMMFVYAERESVLDVNIPLDTVLRRMVQDLYRLALDYCLGLPVDFKDAFDRCNEVFRMWKDRDHAAVRAYVQHAPMEESLRSMYLKMF